MQHQPKTVYTLNLATSIYTPKERVQTILVCTIYLIEKKTRMDACMSLLFDSMVTFLPPRGSYGLQVKWEVSQLFKISGMALVCYSKLLHACTGSYPIGPIKDRSMYSWEYKKGVIYIYIYTPAYVSHDLEDIYHTGEYIHVV